MHSGGKCLEDTAEQRENVAEAEAHDDGEDSTDQWENGTEETANDATSNAENGGEELTNKGATRDKIRITLW